MKHFIRALLMGVLMMLTSGTTWAEPTQSAKRYAVKWISEQNTRATPSEIKSIVDNVFKQASKHKIDPWLILSVIKKESTFNRRARNKSSATGLMQVIPYWHRDKTKGRDLMSIPVNIEVGSIVLRDCLYRHNQNVHRSLNCYSGGGGKRYYADVKRTQAVIGKWVVEQQFINYHPVYYAGPNEPLTKGDT